MSKLIKPTDVSIEKVRTDFLTALKAGKWKDGVIDFHAEIGTVDRKATVFFNADAWCKMQWLIQEFDSEVGWHGIAYRVEGDDAYCIEDILVYPQEVDNTTVTTDQGEYEKWLMSHDDDVFPNIRMQGHSHVNMSTSPSAVDKNLYKGIVEQLKGDMFYIFLIWNKKNERNIMIYDFAKNILFENKDITVRVEGYDFDIFAKDAKEKVKTKPKKIDFALPKYINPIWKPMNEEDEMWDSDWDDDMVYLR